MSRMGTAVGSGNRLKLGLFSPNTSGGMTPTLVPERWDPTWENNVRLARMADDAGLEFLLPGARWIGFGGASRFQDKAFETLVWAAGILASTKRITVFSTVHVTLVHPVFAGMQMATADHIGKGRLGLNVVCGWRPDEFAMFGVGLASNETRYELGEEWLAVVRRLWTSSEPFDFAGRFFTLQGVRGELKPHGDTEPVVMNAGFSPAGRAFAARNCDFLFSTMFAADDATRDEVAAFKRQAKVLGREVGVCVCACIVCRPTREEALEYQRYYATEHADWGAVDEIVRLMGTKVPPERLPAFRDHVASGAGLYPIVGDPDDVAAELARLHGLGFDGAAVGWVNYLSDLPFFCQEVLPRLESRGLRGRAGP